MRKRAESRIADPDPNPDPAHGQSPRPRSTPQVDPQHPQDHADDGADRHARVQEAWTGPSPPRPTPGGSPPWSADLARSGLEVRHPLLEPRRETATAILLVLTANRGLCGGYNAERPAAGLRPAATQLTRAKCPTSQLEVSGKRGISAFRFREHPPDETFTHFEDKPTFDEVEVLANRYLDAYRAGAARPARRGLHEVREPQPAAGVVETLLPLAALAGRRASEKRSRPRGTAVRVPPLGREHPRRGRADQLQGEAVQVLPRRGRERADRPDGGHEGRHRERRRR